MVVCVLLILAGAGAAPVAAQAERGPDRPLYLAAESDVNLARKTLTTYEPQRGNETRNAELFQRFGRAVAGFSVEQPPANWTLPKGSDVSFAIWLNDLDSSIPSYDPTLGPLPGFMEVRFMLRDGFTNRTQEDPTSLPEESEPLGMTIYSFRYDEVPAGAVLFEDRFETTRAKNFFVDGEGVKMTLEIEVRGSRGVEGSDIDVIVGSTSYDSAVVIDGFPWEALREHEDNAVRAARCLELTLAGEPCDDPAVEPSPEPRAAPVAALDGLFAVVLGSLLAAGVFSSRSRK